jgi:hypothetical protein
MSSFGGKRKARVIKVDDDDDAKQNQSQSNNATTQPIVDGMFY